MLEKFNQLYNKIIYENSDKKKLIFDTYNEAREFLNKNYNGHGPIYDINGDLIETCRCIKSVHDQKHIPYVQCKQTVEQVKQEKEQKIKDILNKEFKDDSII